ncbi:MAG: c-type cytochrome, partial [Planctomycetaceae bacterium]|nr:c-type cytochrome [Planctomycetaceae bacterium]
KTLERNLASNDPKLRSAAIGATVDLQDWGALKKLLAGSDAAEAVRGEIVERVMNSVGGALVLLKWLDENAIQEPLKGKVIAQAVKHPDANVRVLYEKFVPEDQRPKRLGSAIKAADILALTGDAKRGESIFHQSTAAQCKNCHRVRGQGNTTGPDLTMIGKKYERATLLETILDPSKAIAPEYTPYIVQTTDGLVFAGFVVDRNDREVVLKDIQNKQIRLRTKDIESIEEQKKSLMPELVLRDVTAQDAADLLAYMLTLTSP